VSETARAVPDLNVITAEELIALPEPEWIIPDFVAEKSTTMVYGEWGLGKSFFVLDMMLKATTGGEWHGGRVIKRPLNILYIIAEGAAHWGKRFRAYGKEHGYDSTRMFIVPQPVGIFSPGDDVPEGIEQIEAFLQVQEEYGQPIDIIVFDTWIRVTGAFGLSENTAGDSAKVIRQLDRIRDTYGVSPVIVHHPTKGDGGFRGDGNLGASVERVIKLKPVKNSRAMFDVEDEKGNHLDAFDTFRMAFRQVQLEPDLTSAVIEMAAEQPRENESRDGYDTDVDRVRAAIAPWGTKKVFRPREIIAEGVTNASRALAELAHLGEIEKIGHGKYRKFGETEDN
jgi:RecA-family ATPase